jgi:hypothetical protein
MVLQRQRHVAVNYALQAALIVYCVLTRSGLLVSIDADEL